MSKAMNPKIVRTIIRNLSQNSSGFTLTELLAAIAITGILVAGSSVGLNVILQENAENEEEILQRQNANRALDFIAEEIKSAQEISNNPSTVSPSNFGLPSNTSGGQKILALSIPDFVDPVIYTIAQPDSSIVWQGPRVIYRWGPNLNADGTYSDEGNSSGWQNRPLIDFVTDQTDSNLPSYCSESGVTQVPSSSPAGFYICVEDDSDPSTPSRVAEVVIRGESDSNVEVSMKAFARSNP
ncbi:MAG: prepilin-type N-terminal cleavage/methylation domain-containing protein [Halothece sp. Uz-M2-17]|nr:prepilin-type N-terminal cleavage/methylation domain-containing protein [Halothece sp. Uz-M2-17]